MFKWGGGDIRYTIQQLVVLINFVVHVVVVYLFQQCKQNIQFQHNKFNKARQPEGQMPVMLATYSTNEVIVSDTIVLAKKEKRRR